MATIKKVKYVTQAELDALITAGTQETEVEYRIKDAASVSNEIIKQGLGNYSGTAFSSAEKTTGRSLIGAEASDATIIKQANVVDNVTSTTTTAPLSANQGKLLNDRINNLESMGRYLALWNAVSGLPTTNPTTMPYSYKSGDYYRVGMVKEEGMHKIHCEDTYAFSIDTFIIDSTLTTPLTSDTFAAWLIAKGYNSYTTPYSNVSGTYMGMSVVGCYAGYSTEYSENYLGFIFMEQGDPASLESAVSLVTTTDTEVTTNYKPNGATYTGAASTTVETGEVTTGDVYFYDGTSWSLQINHLGGFVQDVQYGGVSVVSAGVATIPKMQIEFLGESDS